MDSAFQSPNSSFIEGQGRSRSGIVQMTNPVVIHCFVTLLQNNGLHVTLLQNNGLHVTLLTMDYMLHCHKAMDSANKSPNTSLF